MRLLPFVFLAAATSTAFADEVFKAGDYEIVATDRNIDVRKAKRRTTLFPGSAFRVAAKTDGKKVTITRSYECAADVSTSFTFDQLEARLVNHEAVSLHLKKEWAGAAKGFAQVAKLDPTWNLGGYNLASALTRLGKLDDANAALAPWFGSAPLATYLQVAIDPDLQPLLATKAVAAVRGATKPGTIKIGQKGLVDDYAYSADRGWLAVHHSSDGYPPCGGHAAISIFEIKTGKHIGSIDLGGIPHSGGPCGTAGRAAIAKAEDARRAKAAIAESILVGFGFANVPGETVGVNDSEGAGGKRTARLPKAKLGVVLGYTGTVNVLRGNTSITTAPIPVGGIWVSVGHVPDASAMVFTGYSPSDTCARTDEGVIHIPASPSK